MNDSYDLLKIYPEIKLQCTNDNAPILNIS